MTKPTFFLLSGDYATDATKVLVELNPELRAIDNRLRATQHFEVVAKQRAAYNDLLQVVKQHNALRFFHYSGHANSENIFLQSDTLAKEPLSAEKVSALLAIQKKPIKLAILNGCVSEKQAAAFLAIGVDFVIATTRSIRDDEARRFADKFYENFLLATHSIVETLHLSLIELYKTAKEERFAREEALYTYMGWYDQDSYNKECPYCLYIRKGADKNWGLREEIAIVQKQALLPAPPPLESKLYNSHTGMLLGREKELKDIHELLQSEKALILMNGMRGIGKSTLAAAYSHIYKAAYTHISYLTVLETDENVLQALIRTFKDAFELWETKPENLLAAILHKLQNYEKERLLIIDNANNEAAILAAKHYLTDLDWKVLFTSRSNAMGIKDYKIDTLHRDDALALFRLHCQHKHSLADIQQLLANVLYHTLLVEFMAKTLELNSDILIQELLTITENTDFTNELLSFTTMTTTHQDFTSHTQNPIVVSEYLIQIFPVQGLNEEEQRYLLYFSILPAKFIAFDTLLQLFAIETQTTDKLRCKQHLQALYRKGWLQYDEKEAYYCHPLLQHLIRQQLKPNAENCAVIIESLINKFYREVTDNPLDTQIWLPYGVSVLYYIQDHTDKIAILCNNIGETYRVLGNLTKSLKYGLKALAIFEKILFLEHPNLAASYNNLALTYQASGDLSKSLEYSLKTLAIFEKILSSEHHNLAISYNNIGETYRLLGDLAKSLEYGLKALAIREKILSPEHPSLAISYNNVANIYQVLGDLAKSLQYGFMALEIREKVLPPEHPDLAASYNNMAITYERLGDLAKSLEYGLKALVIYEKVLSPKHLNLATSYNNIAITYKALGNLAKFLEYNLKALKIREKVLSPKHPNLADSYNNIAIAYAYMQEWELSLSYMKKAIIICKQLFSINPNDLKDSLAFMSDILAAAKNKVAKEVYEEYREWFEGL